MTKDIDQTRRTLLTTGVAAAAMGASATVANAQTRASEGAFTDQIVVITGGTSGIGRATAELFAQEGAQVVFNGRREALGAEVVAAIEEAGGKARYVPSDVRDRDQVRAFIDGVVDEFGRIDVAFNNAGIAIPPSPIETIDPAMYDDIIATNVNGVFWSLVNEVRHMKTAGSGVIINTSSVFGPHAADTQVAYGATRSAVDAMTAAVAKEVGQNGIRVMGIAPGATVGTDLFRFIGREWTDDEVAYFGTLAGLGRAGQPIDLARAVVSMAGAAGSFVHGTTLKVDGQFLQA